MGQAEKLNRDSEIAIKLKKGDIAFIKNCFSKYYTSLYFYARKFINNDDVVKDIIQDTFLYLWENHKKINNKCSLQSYLFRSIHNGCINYIRRSRLKNKYIEEYKLKIHAFAGESGLIQQIITNELRVKIDKSIESFPEHQKRIFKMSRHQGLSHKEIASQLSLSPRTVEAQVYKSLKTLRTILK